MRRIVFSVILLLLGIFAYAQQSIRFDNGLIIDSIIDSTPSRDVEFVSDGIVVTYHFDYANIYGDSIYINRFLLNIDGLSYNDTGGEPRIPFVRDSFTIPVGYSASVSVIDSAYYSTYFQLSPARPELYESEYTYYCINNVPSIRPYSGYYPKSVVPECDSDSYRGISIIDVCLSPIKYNEGIRRLQMYNEIKYKITFTPIPGANNTPAQIDVARASEFLDDITVNGYNFYGDSVITYPHRLRQFNYRYDAGYLIVSTPEYEDAVSRFAEWKRILGYNVKIELRNDWTPATIKNYIQSQNNIEYILIVGDNNDVPPESLNNRTSHISDYHYGCLNSNKYQEILVGRIPASSIIEANNAICKIMSYEREPVCDSLFYQSGIVCAQFQDDNLDREEDRRFTRTSEDIRGFLNQRNPGYNVHRVYYAEDNVSPLRWSKEYSNGAIIPNELQKPFFLWNGTKDNIVQYTNNGAFFIFYRGHGVPSYWTAPYFSYSDIDLLNNTNRLPVLFSICCSSGDFEYSNCLCSSLLFSNSGGCVGSICATQVSPSKQNDVLSLGLFDAIWPSHYSIANSRDLGCSVSYHTPIYNLGNVLRQGKVLLDKSKYKKDNTNVVYMKEIYHYLGDPSMEIYTAQPTVFDNVSIIRNDTAIIVTTGSEASTISFYDKVTKEVTLFKYSSATYSTNNPNIVVCVNAHNKIPYIDDPTGDIYIQNEVINGTRVYSGRNIHIGSNVTSEKPTGSVTFNGGNIRVIGNELEIQGETEIQLGTEFEFNNR